MNIIPVASDSMGVRSMCTFVHTPKLNILIDPGVALAKKRMGLPPSNIEFRTLNVFKNKIVNFAQRSDVVLITHYHYSHYIAGHDETFNDIYSGKVVLCKNRKTKLNFRQRTRGKEFEIGARKISKEFHFIDNNTFNFDNVNIKCSKHLWHGVERTSLGYLILLTIKHKSERFLFASDVMGPVNKDNTEYIIKENPDILFISGLATHLLDYSVPKVYLEQSINAMKDIMSKTKVKTIIYDHYPLRDINYKVHIKPLYSFARKKKIKFLTAAEYVNMPIRQLEAKRQELTYEDEF